MEPIAIRPVPDSRARLYGAKQLIFRASNGYGMSVITTESGNRVEHGWYLNPGEYEAHFIFVPDPEKPFSWRDATNEHGDTGNPKGWLSVEDLGWLCDEIENKGLDAWNNWPSRG